MFTFCDVSHEAKKTNKQTLESAQHGLEISFKSDWERRQKKLSVLAAIFSWMQKRPENSFLKVFWRGNFYRLMILRF